MTAIQADALIVASWGNPYSWGLARYTYRGSEAEARTSLAAVADSYSSPYLLVIVADTVYAAPKGFFGCEPPGRARERPSSYQELVNAVKRDIRAWVVECSGSEQLKQLLEKDRMVIEVVPGTGSYKVADATRYRFVPGDEPAATYAGWAMGLILQALLEARPQKLIMDATHGINYMPLALRRAVEAAALSYAAATGNKVSLEVVNSEPYPMDVSTETPRLEVWRAEEKHIEPGLARDQAALAVKQGPNTQGKMLNLNKRLLAQNSLSELGKTVNSIVEKAGLPGAKLLLAAANIVLYSMPLAAAYLAAETPQDTLSILARLLAKIRRLAVEHGVVRKSGGIIEVGPGLALSADKLEPALYGTALVEAIHRAVAGLDLANIYVDGLDTASLKKVTAGLGGLYKVIAENELNSLEENCRKLPAPGDAEPENRSAEKPGCSEEKCPLEVGAGAWPKALCDHEADSSLHSRNLRAHAGLEKNITEAMVDEAGRLWLRYRLRDGRPLCWEKLRAKLGEGSF